MKIFGGWLPFAGWVEIDVDNDGEPSEFEGWWKADAFMVEWLHRGAILYIGEIKRA